MNLISKSLLGVIAALVVVGSVSADPIRPSHDYDDDWDSRVMRFTPEWRQLDQRGND
ncbi:hypothetical protein QKW35_18135 [Pontibacterium granulatum]|uniref:hypothetical protein n=1 Tax=Pontibacterium granulatum TaxID=2036029 RepID=UPI00249BFA99|nr:hypothetical protein [Pontibacterium granulatum]MDI3326300.1 hypothetical protein [Pontibacterium granulatum]